MGRISNVVSVRQYKSQNWLSTGLWGKYNYSLKYIEIKTLIENIFKKIVQRHLGFLLSSVRVVEFASCVHIKLYFADMLAFESRSYNGSRSFNFDEYQCKVLFLEKILLEALLVFSFCKPVKFTFSLIPLEGLSAALVAKYIITKLEKKFTLGETIYPLLRLLSKIKDLQGFRIDCSGRFTRKQRASHLTFKGGATPFSTLESNFDYEEGFVVLKYGKCGLKVWLFRKKPFYSTVCSLNSNL